MNAETPKPGTALLLLPPDADPERSRALTRALAPLLRGAGLDLEVRPGPPAAREAGDPAPPQPEWHI